MKTLLMMVLALGVRSLAVGGSIGDPKLMNFAGLDSTAAVAFCSSCGYYVTDDVNASLQHYSASGALISTVSSTPNGGSIFASPSGLDVDAQGNVWVADADNNRVEELDPSGSVVAYLGVSPDAGALNWPNDVAVGPQNRLYVADSGNNRVAVYDRSSGAFLFSWGSFGFADSADTQPLLFAAPMGLTVSNGQVYVADAGNARVQVYGLDGSYVSTIGGRGMGPGGFDSPYDVAVDSSGRVWVADNGAQNVQIFNAAGGFVAGLGLGFDGFDFEDLTHLYAEADGDVMVADGYADRFFIWDSTVVGMRSPAKAASLLAQAPLHVGPVPARAGQALQLTLPAPADKVTWQLYTADMRLAGQTESSGTANVSYTQTASLSAGVYLARLVVVNEGATRESVQKIVITR